jgi:hypothetical protein
LTAPRRDPNIRIQWIVKFWYSGSSKRIEDCFAKDKAKDQNNSLKTKGRILAEN